MRSLHFAMFGLALSASLLACRGETTEEAPIVPIRNMYNQPKYQMQGGSSFYDDHRAMRPLPEGVVARDEVTEPRLAHGRLDDGSGYVLTIPPEMIEQAGGMDKMLARGQERFNIYCSACHGLNGAGEGPVVKHGMQQPPSYHQDRIRHMPDGQLFATIENGIRNMPAYGPQTTVADRWAIVAYVRALQVSQAPLATSEKKP